MPKGIYKHSEKHNQNIGDGNRGKKRSLKSRKKMSEIQISKREKTSELLKLAYKEGRRKPISLKGKLHWNWQGGLYSNSDYVSWHKNKRNRMKRTNGGFHSFEEWELLKAQYNWTCPCCKKSEPEIKLVQDHIIPVSKGGSDNIENIQPLCRGCNAKKHDKNIKY